MDRWGLYRDYKLFNVDFRMEHRYFMAHDLFPMGLLEYDGRFHHLDTPYRLDYALPDLRVCRLDLKVEARQRIPTMEDRLLSAHLNDTVLEGDEAAVLEDLDRTLRRMDPDVVVTDGGDAFYLDYLRARAELNGVPVELGRDAGHAPGQGQELLHLRPHRVQGPGAQAARAHPHRFRRILHVRRVRPARGHRPVPAVAHPGAGDVPPVAGHAPSAPCR